ncbi:MAG: SRPBCC family protein [Sphingomonadales bacterium]|nr:SRPBCC family protein [Sphingomonadaceae bacterium]MBS3931098.1 SRPBCC family protein [Sphingomonadales bacterium]
MRLAKPWQSARKETPNAQNIDDCRGSGALDRRNQPGLGRSDASRHEQYARPKEAGQTEAKAKASGSASTALCPRPRRTQDDTSAFIVAFANTITVTFSNADETRWLLLSVSESAMDCCGKEKRNGSAPPAFKRRGGAAKQAYRYREVATVDVAADPAAVFGHLDDHQQLASHMMQSSAMMAGSAMNFTFDQGRGRLLGSRIGMSGKVLGLVLEMNEIVTERDPPRRKVWETEGTPRLLVIGSYRMGFDISPEGLGSRLRVSIEYDLPAWPWRLLGLIAGRFYARWCVRAMANDAAREFAV